MKGALQKLIALPMAERRAIAAFLAAVVEELTTADPPRRTRDQELDQLAELEHELRALPPVDRCAAILERMPSIGSRSAYYRLRKKISASPTNPT